MITDVLPPVLVKLWLQSWGLYAEHQLLESALLTEAGLFGCQCCLQAPPLREQWLSQDLIWQDRGVVPNFM